MIPMFFNRLREYILGKITVKNGSLSDFFREVRDVELIHLTDHLVYKGKRDKYGSMVYESKTFSERVSEIRYNGVDIKIHLYRPKFITRVIETSNSFCTIKGNSLIIYTEIAGERLHQYTIKPL